MLVVDLIHYVIIKAGGAYNTWQNIIKKRMQDIGETQESLAEKLRGLDIKASVGAAYLNSDVKEVIKLIEYDSEQAKDLFNGVNTENLKVINILGDSMQGTF